MGRSSAADHVGCDNGKALRDLAADGFIGERLRRNFLAKIGGDELRRLIDPRPGALRILRNQPAADGESAEADNHAAVDQRQLGGAAANIDMQQAGIARFRQRHRPGIVGGEPGFKLVAGRGADELAGFLGEQLVDGAGVGALDRLAGEDDGAELISSCVSPASP